MRAVAALVLLSLASLQTSGTPDIVILNARVFTGDRALPWAEAVAVRGNSVSAVGSTSDVRALSATTTRVIDASGRLLIPGINDAHMHPPPALAVTRLEGPSALEHDPTLDEVLKRLEVAVAKAPEGGWIDGEIGLSVLADSRATRTTLDRVSAGHPLLLEAWTGHGIIANSEAFRKLGIREDEADPPGGHFIRSTDGRTLTGLAEEYAGYLLRRRLGMLADPAAQLRMFEALAQESAAFGITSLQAVMTAYPVETASERLAAADLRVRIRLIDFPLSAMARWRPRKPFVRPSTPPLVTISGTKWILDGTPVERLMFLRAPYADSPSTRGRLNFPNGELRAFLQRALNAHEQPLLHAGGDDSIDATLDALEASGGTRWKPLRPRIEHADLLGAEDFARISRMGVIVVQNPSHFMIPAVMEARFGANRARQTAQVKNIVAAGLPFALGSDGPLNPFLNIMFATLNPTNPSQQLTVEQALTAYTAGAAAAEFAEGEKGMLKPGMLADMALLSQDIFKVPPAELPTTTSMLTIVNGRIVYDRMSR